MCSVHVNMPTWLQLMSVRHRRSSPLSSDRALLLIICSLLHHRRQAVCSWYAIRSFSQMRSRRMYVSEPRCCTIANNSACTQQYPRIRTAHESKVVSSRPERQSSQTAAHFMHTGA